jgi:molybdopterin-binding protein
MRFFIFHVPKIADLLSNSGQIIGVLKLRVQEPVVDRILQFLDNRSNRILQGEAPQRFHEPFGCFSLFKERMMKPKDIVFTKNNLMGTIKKVYKGSDSVVVEFKIPLKSREIVVSSKISRRSLRVSKGEDYRSTAKRKGTN